MPPPPQPRDPARPDRAIDLRAPAGAGAVNPADAARGLPAKHGVLVFEHRADDAQRPETIAVIATADLRAAAQRRLAGESGPKADLSAVCGGLLAWVCGSSFEADALWLELARSRAPKTYTAALERWTVWFLRLDPRAEQPVWAAVDPLALGRAEREALAPETLIGPFATRDQARGFGRWLDDTFELCREPARLAKRPDATACAYKQMGLCPAACDGSEPMSAYRARVRAALDLVRTGPDTLRQQLEHQMRDAAAAMDFERAATLRERLDRLADLNTPAWRRATTLDRFAALAVRPAGRTGWARLIAHAGGRSAWIADVRADRDGHEAAEPALERFASTQRGVDLSRPAIERLCVAARALLSPRRGAGAILPLYRGVGGTAGADRAPIRKAVRAAARVDRDQPDAAAATGELSC